MVRRRFHSPRLDDEVPFVPVGHVRSSLRDGASGNFDYPVLVYGLDKGLGVTRTLQEFYWESVDSNNANRHVAAAIDFYEIGDRPLGHILLELRNQLIASCNQINIDDAHIHFKHFDVAYDLWANLHYRDGMKPPILVTSNSQDKKKRRRKFVTSAGVGILSGGLVQTELLAGWLEAALSETGDQVTDQTMKKLRSKYQDWIRTTAWQRSKRLRDMTAGQKLKPQFIAETLEYLFEESIVMLSRFLDGFDIQTRLIFALDSLDEYESERTPVGFRREWFCHFVEMALPKPILIAMGSRGLPKKWRAGMVDVKPKEENIAPLPRDAVLRLLNTIDVDRTQRVVELVLPEGKSKITATELADAWGACAIG